MAYTDKLRVVYGDYTLGVHGEGFDYIFSYAQGGLESIVKNGYEWLYRCPKPTFWRALTDNDRGSKFHIKSRSWLSAGSLTAREHRSLWMEKCRNHMHRIITASVGMFLLMRSL